jgi:hypothetical protein
MHPQQSELCLLLTHTRRSEAQASVDGGAAIPVNTKWFPGKSVIEVNVADTPLILQVRCLTLRPILSFRATHALFPVSRLGSWLTAQHASREGQNYKLRFHGTLVCVAVT